MPRTCCFCELPLGSRNPVSRLGNATSRVPVKGNCAEGSRKIKHKFVDFGVSKRPPATGRPIKKGGGRSPPPFRMGLPEAGSRLDPKNRRICAFIFRLPSAQLPFAACRTPIPKTGAGCDGKTRLRQGHGRSLRDPPPQKIITTRRWAL